MKRINILGFGLIGKERAKAIGKLQRNGFPVELGLVFDPFLDKSLKEWEGVPFQVTSDFSQFLESPSDLTVIACPHDVAVESAFAVLKAGKTTLLEKPLGRNLVEADHILSALQKTEQLHVGFNYRFMPGVAQLLKDTQAGQFGDLISVTIQMGHGGRPGDEATWKLDPVRCGGGALLDPGIHLLDLICRLSGDVPVVEAAVSSSKFWRTGIDEDSHVIMKNRDVIFNLHVSVVKWRSVFQLTVNGTEGYGVVSGRGRSYGPQTYTTGKRWGWQQGCSQSESEELVLTTPCEDSFSDELAAVLGFSQENVDLMADCDSALCAMKLYDSVIAKIGQ